MTMPEGVQCELICVDNNSTDDTRRVVETLARGSPVPLRYLFEARQGSSNARNTGFRHARGEIIAVTDDDCMVGQTWLSDLWNEFQQRPSLGLLGGRVELHDPADLPVTIRTSRQRANFTEESLFTLIAGCNFAFRGKLIDEIGLFDPDLGPGTPLMSAEDVDFIYRASKARVEIAYAPDVLLYHAHGRRSELDRRKLERGYLIGRGAFYAKHILARDRQVTRLAYWELSALAKSLVRRALTRRSGGEALTLAHLLSGGFAYLSLRMRRRVGAPAKSRCSSRPQKSG
jgi:GT2 family glycosyltransferase